MNEWLIFIGFEAFLFIALVVFNCLVLFKPDLLVRCIFGENNDLIAPQQEDVEQGQAPPV